MCGIIGAISTTDVVNELFEGLVRLEYRGYDSAGIAVIDPHDQFQRLRIVGKVKALGQLLHTHYLSGHTGIAHTRWATHGKPSEKNAHPHIVGNEIALVHNGIIENHESLRSRLKAKGCEIQSDTDSELIAHLIYQFILEGKDLLTAMLMLGDELEGTYAIGLIRSSEPGRMLAIRRGSPLIIGLTEQAHYISSDRLALLPFTKKFIYLGENEIADIKLNEIAIYHFSGKKINYTIHEINENVDSIDKGKYAHFMLKEIFEQPDAVARTLQGRFTSHAVLGQAFGENAPHLFQQVRRVQIVACGSSYHAGLVGKFWLEEIAGVSCQVEIASEYRYRPQIVETDDTLFLTLSQSGETADTLAALRLAKQLTYLSTLVICNVAGSSLVRESDLVFMLDAGPEIGVASTKAFTCQLAALFMLSIGIAQYKGLDQTKTTEWIKQLSHLPTQLSKVLALDPQIKEFALVIAKKHHTLFLGRGIQYPIALEGALKLKEIAYIHAEAFPAGELKHGPLALVDPSMPVIALAPSNHLLEKMKSNLEEVLARGGKLFILTDQPELLKKKKGVHLLMVPKLDLCLSPVAYAVLMQLLAYHVAVLKNTDIDQPRNLAKSVTVE